MKIFLIRKIFLKQLIAVCFLLITALFLVPYMHTSIAIELSKNSVLSKATIDKIANLSNETEKIAYLTFDDGPNPAVTPKILDILKEENVKNPKRNKL